MGQSQSQLARTESLIERGGGDLAESLECCRRITARAGSSFGVGIRLTPARCRDAMHAIYAWMRLADDAADADAPAGDRGVVLDRMGSLTARAFAGQASGSIWPAFASTVAAHGLEQGWFESFLAGMRTDLGPVALETHQDLEQYCDRVAGNVGRCCVAIWGFRSGADADRGYHLAGLRGRAFQLINIARDLEEDARAGRRYVPAERLRHLNAGATDPAVRADLLREAIDLLEGSSSLDAMVRRDAGPALWAMTRAYRLVARRSGQAGANASLGGGAKLGIAAGAIGRRVLAAGRLA
ncbi:MAG: phytoene/squalene synthase family protein [Phycisphaerales bacterium JB060]